MTADSERPETGLAADDRRRLIAENITGVDPVPWVEYTEDEHETWNLVTGMLEPLHEVWGCEAFRDGVDALGLGVDGVPQLSVVGDILEGISGFRLLAAPGIVPAEEFYGVLADHRFMAAQFVRDSASPLFSPDPDVIHELIGHANVLANPVIANIYLRGGEAYRTLGSPKAREEFSRVWWFTFETGVIVEDGEVKAFGAALLSSPGELEQLDRAVVRRVRDVVELIDEPYDITGYQPVLFAFDGFDHLEDTLLNYFQTNHNEVLRTDRGLQ